MNIYKIYILIFVALLSVSCEDFLDENPSKTTSLVPTTLEHLEYLLNDYNTFADEANSAYIFGTDDYGLIKDLYDARRSVYSVETIQHALWDVDNIPDAQRHYWPSEYKKIFTANMVLSYLSEVSGDEAVKKNIKAEAHFLRAYSNFVLANTYCLPYTDANKEELGLPVKASTSFEESAERATLEETWKFIQDDLEKALEITTSLGNVGDTKKRTWRASKASVYAFAARYYLVRNDYNNAKTYAEKALAEHSDLIDYNTEMRYSDVPNSINVDGEEVELLYPYTHDRQTDPTDKMEWKELYYYRFLSHGSWWYIPSQDLLDTYDQENDLRYRYHMVEHYSFDRGCIDPVYDYPGYVGFHKDDLPSGPTVGEMILTKAECQIRLGQWEQGIETVNELRAKRMDSNATQDKIDLSADSQAEALTKVIVERRREMPFTSRWRDIRRYNSNNNPADDVTVTRTFYPYNSSVILLGEEPITYTLEPGSRRFARPLPNTDIIVTDGVLKQNNY